VASKSPCEPGIGVDLGRRLPLSKELTDRRKVVDHRDGKQSSGEFLEEQLPIGARQEGRPGERLIDRRLQTCRAVDEEASQQSSECVERFIPFLLTVCLAQAERWSIPAPKDDVVVGQICDDLIRLTQELREGSLDHTHALTISELLQKSMRWTTSATDATGSDRGRVSSSILSADGP
jgi:hypothetical protein